MSNRNLNVKGRGLNLRRSPRMSPDRLSATSSTISLSDVESQKSDEQTVLDNVREMNQMLVRQTEILRMKISIDERNYSTEKAKLVDLKNSQIESKELEIDDLRESLNIRDERIKQLMKDGTEKDKAIQSKSLEIEDLKTLVKQTKEFAQKIQKQCEEARKKKGKLEPNGLSMQQNEQVVKLGEEVELFRTKVALLEQELERAIKVIEQQNMKLERFDEEKQGLQAKLKDDLNKATRAMMHEVERMREVMRQNYEELKMLRKLNQRMQSDIHAIRDMLNTPRTGQGEYTTEQIEKAKTYLSAASSQQLLSAKEAEPTGQGQMSSRSHSADMRKLPGLFNNNKSPRVRESDQFIGKEQHRDVQATTPQIFISKENTDLTAIRPVSRLTPDPVARPIKDRQVLRADNKYTSMQYLNVPSDENKATERLKIPPICSIKEGTSYAKGQSSIRGGKMAIRKGRP